MIDGRELGKQQVGDRLDIWPDWGEVDRDEEGLKGRWAEGVVRGLEGGRKVSCTLALQLF